MSKKMNARDRRKIEKYKRMKKNEEARRNNQETMTNNQETTINNEEIINNNQETITDNKEINQNKVEEISDIKMYIDNIIKDTLKTEMKNQLDDFAADTISGNTQIIKNILLQDIKNVDNNMQKLDMHMKNKATKEDIYRIKDIIIEIISRQVSKNYNENSREIRFIATEYLRPLKPQLSKLDKIDELEYELQSIKKEYRKMNSKLDDVSDIINHIEQMNNSLNQVISTIELLQGKMKSLDSINEISEKLSSLDKKSNKEEKVASNLDEEILINLGGYGEEILKELTNAARCYAQNKDVIGSIYEERNEYERKILETKEKYKEEGIKDGKLNAMKDLLSKLDGIDDLFDSEDPFKKVIADMLKNNGFSRDEELMIGKEIVITEENKEEISAKALNIDLGKYRVVNSAILLNDKIYKEAVLSKIDEEL